MDSQVIEQFGNSVRVRVSGLCCQGDQVLLINHRNVGPDVDFWAPPGGGVHFGESVREALQREFREETGLDIQVGDLLFVNEFIGLPLHAVELFFLVQRTSGNLQTGTDPEMQRQLIADVRFLSFSAINLIPEAQKHNLFRHCQSVEELRRMRGFYSLVR